jgi:hypothetical protein
MRESFAAYNPSARIRLEPADTGRCGLSIIARWLLIVRASGRAMI